MASVKAYADAYVTDAYRDDFMAFVQPDAIREGLSRERVISFRYMVRRHDRESYETVRFAGVDSFVSKPLFANSVMDEFREAFKNRRAAGPPRAELKGRRVLMAEDLPDRPIERGFPECKSMM